MITPTVTVSIDTPTLASENVTLCQHMDAVRLRLTKIESLEALVERLAALEAMAADKIPAFDRWQARQDGQLAEFTDRLSSLERLAQGIIDNP